MKNKLLFLILFILSPFVMHAQVGIGVEDPHPSAALEMVSKEKGLLISRMTLSEKNAIQNPAESLLIYQTDGDIGFYYFDGSFWVYLKNIKQINADWNATSGIAQILNKPAIAKAGTSGDFNDLLNIPALVLAGDTSKMLLPYLTLDKIQPLLDGKASVADLNKEMARAIQLEQQLAAIDVKVTANTSGIQTNATTIGLKESSANKSTDVTLADGTDTKFPTEKAVKTYVDQAISNRGVGVPYTGAMQTLNLGNNDLKTTSNITASGFLVPNATNSQFLKGDGTLDSKQYVEVKTNTVAIGTDAGKLGQQQNAIAIGAEAGSEIQKQNSIAIGAGAGRGLQEVGSIAIGYVAGDGGQGSHSIALGSNVAQGAQAAESVGIGYAAAQYNQGEKSVALGAFAGKNNQSNNAVAIGYNAQTAAPNSVALGSGAVANTSNTIQLGNSDVTAVKTSGKLTTGAITLPNLDGTSGQVLSTNGAGLVSWATPSTATNATFMDLTSAQTVAGDKTFSSNIIVNGVSVGRGNGNNDESLAIGQGAMGVSNTNGKRNTAVGWGAMRSYVGTGFDNNTSLGYNNLPGLTTGSGNTSVGAESMMALTTGTENTSLGNQSLINTKGNDNVGIGKRSGQTISTGSQNTIVGTNADVSVGSLSNATALGNQAVATASNTIQLGNSAVTAVKTSGKLTTGAITLPNLDGTSGQVLSTNGAGVVSWATPSTATNGTFVDLTSAQTVGGAKTFNSNILVNGMTVGTTSVDANTNSSNYATVLGINATAGSYATSIGNNATAGSSYGVAIGRNASAGTSYSIAIGGLDATASQSYSVAIGGNAPSATGVYSTAIGGSVPTASANFATALGSSTTASGQNSTALGYGASVSSPNTIQLGNTSVTNVKTSGKITTGAITLPNTDGVNGQVLTTNGAGVAAWSTPTSSTNPTILNTVTIEWSALNNYDVSNVTVIFVRPNSSWTDIYGLQGGVLGQVIHIYTVNNQTSNCCVGLSLKDYTSSNNNGIQKFVAPGTIGIDSNENTTLIFDGTYWRVTRTQ